MKIRPKDHIYWEIIYETEEEAQAMKDYFEQLLTKGVVEKADWQVEIPK